MENDIINTLYDKSGKFLVYDKSIIEEGKANMNLILVKDIIENSCLNSIPVVAENISKLNLSEWNILDLYEFPGDKDKICALINICDGFIDPGNVNGYILLQTSMLGFLNEFKILVQIPYIGGLGFILISPDTPEIYKVNKEEILEIINKIFK